MAKGKSRADAYKIAVAQMRKSGNMEPNSTKLTAKGVQRSKMTPEERAVSRAGKKPGEVHYDYQTNTTRKL